MFAIRILKEKKKKKYLSKISILEKENNSIMEKVKAIYSLLNETENEEHNRINVMIINNLSRSILNKNIEIKRLNDKIKKLKL